MVEIVFGSSELNQKLYEKVPADKKPKNRNNPDKWIWKPNKPEKIKKWKSAVAKEAKAVNYSVITNYRPSNIKQRIVLVFKMGVLSHGLIKNLEKDKIKYFFIDYVQFILKGKIVVHKNKKMLMIDNVSLSLDDVKVVLWEPPKYPTPIVAFEVLPPKKELNKFLFRKRWSQLLKDLLLLIPRDAVWIPGVPLNGSQEWQNKLGEYNLAESIGLNIPPFIFTNDADELKKFAEENGEELLLREFSCPPYSYPIVKINILKNSLKHLEKSPVFFQKYIEKDHEYRVVILFGKIYACKIHSQDSELTKEDWRNHDDSKVKWEISELPISLSKKLITMSKKLGVNWCSIDMIYGKDKKYYYIEANRPGAHYWLDLFVGLDITKEIIKEVKKILN